MNNAEHPMMAYIADAFIKDGSGGSPTGVVLNAGALNDVEMQLMANKIALSHTAFVVEPISKGDNVKVRFFTPSGEILNCGHGTIAAHYTRAKLYGYIGNSTFLQETKGGMQHVEIVGSNNNIEVYLRVNPVQFSMVPALTTQSLLDVLSLEPSDISEHFPIIIASPGFNRLLLGLKCTEVLDKIMPNFEKLKHLCTDNKSIGCFVYTVKVSNMGLEARARMFAPNIGVDEDTINGNSSACLGAYLSKLYGGSDIDLQVIQGHVLGSEGVVKVKVKKHNDLVETVIGGTAKIKPLKL